MSVRAPVIAFAFDSLDRPRPRRLVRNARYWVLRCSMRNARIRPEDGVAVDAHRAITETTAAPQQLARKGFPSPSECKRIPVPDLGSGKDTFL